MITFYAVALLSAMLVGPICGKLPSDVKPCLAGDSDCIVETINKVIETKYMGDDELGLITIDPLKIAKMEVKHQEGSPVNVDLMFENSEVYGYKNFRAYKVRGFGKSPEGKHEIFLTGPSASLIGGYNIEGKILILPIKGNGLSNITIDNVYLKVNIQAGSKEKDGAIYLDVKEVKLNLNTTLAHFELSNLFNGDEALGDNMNKFMNENWHDIYVELRQGILDAFGIVYTEFLRKLFDTHPYNQIVEGGD